MGIGWAELAVCAVVALLAIGPRQLPDLMYQAGRWLRQWRQWRATVERDWRGPSSHDS